MTAPATRTDESPTDLRADAGRRRPSDTATGCANACPGCTCGSPIATRREGAE